MSRRRVCNERAFIARRCAPVLLFLSGMFLLAPLSRAQLNLGPVTVGAGMRSSFDHTELDHGGFTQHVIPLTSRLSPARTGPAAHAFMLNTRYSHGPH